jgi:hypothetical protein
MFFQKNIERKIYPLLAVGLILAGCNVGATPAPTVDINAINTSIVGTTVAQLNMQGTQTALANPSPTAQPTNTAAALPTFGLPTAGGASPTAQGLPTISFNATPLPGFTPLASPIPPGATAALGDECSNSVFEGDVTIPDGSVIAPGTDFQKVWAVRNTGNCTWDDGYALVYVGGSSPNLDPYTFEFKKASDFVAPGAGINLGINLTTPCTPGSYEGHWRLRNDRGYYFGGYLSVYVEVKENC